VLDQGERKKIKTVGRLHPREGKLVVETRAPEGSLALARGIGFPFVVVGAMRQLACEILELLGAEI